MNKQSIDKTIIVVSGPESSGKTHLVESLSKMYPCSVVWEYAREYVENLNRPYTYSDVESIARRQQAEYEKAIKGDGELVFFDTFLIITKVWFDYVYGQCPEWIIDSIRKLKVDLVLLCKPDLPWVADGVRENGHIREELFNRYREEMDNYGLQYKIVEGVGEQRVKIAKQHINQSVLLKPNHDKQSNCCKS